MKILETDGMSGTGFHKKFGNLRHKFQKKKFPYQWNKN